MTASLRLKNAERASRRTGNDGRGTRGRGERDGCDYGPVLCGTKRQFRRQLGRNSYLHRENAFFNPEWGRPSWSTERLPASAGASCTAAARLKAVVAGVSANGIKKHTKARSGSRGSAEIHGTHSQVNRERGCDLGRYRELLATRYRGCRGGGGWGAR